MSARIVSLDGTVAGLAPYAASRFGNAPAFAVADGPSVGFAELLERIAAFAGGLSRLGVARGDRVVLYLANGIGWVVAYHALARIGAVVVPANILLTVEEVGWMACDAEAVAIILPSEWCGDMAEHAATATVRVALGPAVPGAVRFDVVAKGDPAAPGNVSPSDLWTIGYTSGTTGRPKGAMLSHGAVFESAAGAATTHVRTDRDRILSALPLPHVYGNIVMNAAFLSGSEVVLMRRFDAAEALRLIERRGVTLFEGVPTMYHQMLAQPALHDALLTSLTRCTVGGQTMPVAALEAVARTFGCPILELWGMTEVAGPGITHSPYWAPKLGAIGRPFPGLEVAVVDLEDETEAAADDEPGELWVRGRQIFTGYWRNPEASAAAFAPGGWFRTGDVACRSAAGDLQIVDRRKDLIITAGYNIYPAEIEAVVAQIPGVAMVAVAAVPDEEKGELACAFIVAAPGYVIEADAVIAHCRRHLAAYKRPRTVVFVDDLPKTSTGKVARRLLADLLTTHAPVGSSG